MIVAFAALSLFGDQPGIEQDAEVLGNRRSTHFEMPSQCVDRAVGHGKQIEHVAACGMADCSKNIRLAARGFHHATNIGK